MRNIYLTAVALVTLTANAKLSAQEVVSSISVVKPVETTVVDCTCRTIPALTPVSIEILVPVGSKISKTADMFPIRLAAPIVVDGATLVPAGTAGMGEVVHAKKSGSGAGGELILAARYLDLDGHRLRLRSMNLTSRGGDQAALALAASQLVGVFALGITGKNTEIAAGTRAEAKTAEAITLPILPAAAPAAAGAITGETK